MRRYHLLSLVLTAATLLIANGSTLWASEDTSAWEKVRKGTAIAIMRHALAPGTSDPANFSIDDCQTQRNLSDEGRDQARTIGDLFRSNGIEHARVLSSEWCRCMETASLLQIGEVEKLPALNSFFENRSAADGQTQQVRALLPAWLEAASSPTVLVTHQVNINALTGAFTSSGEILIITLTDGEVDVLANIPTNL